MFSRSSDLSKPRGCGFSVISVQKEGFPNLSPHTAIYQSRLDSGSRAGREPRSPLRGGPPSLALLASPLRCWPLPAAPGARRELRGARSRAAAGPHYSGRPPWARAPGGRCLRWPGAQQEHRGRPHAKRGDEGEGLRRLDVEHIGAVGHLPRRLVGSNRWWCTTHHG